jgi:predicted DCC family thiol-disulfide oxidoreductase YuxK
VQFVIKRDGVDRFQFAAMQTQTGRKLLASHGVDPDDPATFLVIREGEALTDTDALISVLQSLHIGWRGIAFVLKLIPRAWRNAMYRFIARNRYRLFGRRDVCYVPSPEDRARFLQ